MSIIYAFSLPIRFRFFPSDDSPCDLLRFIGGYRAEDLQEVTWQACWLHFACIWRSATQLAKRYKKMTGIDIFFFRFVGADFQVCLN